MHWVIVMGRNSLLLAKVLFLPSVWGLTIGFAPDFLVGRKEPCISIAIMPRLPS